MRYDKPVYFQSVMCGAYNPNTGDYEADIVTERKRYASVTDSGDETKLQIYGSLKERSLTVRLQNHYEKSFDYIRIDNAVYRVDRERKLRMGHTFVVSEVQQDAVN